MPAFDKDATCEWLVNRLAELIGTPARAISRDDDFSDHGLSSYEAAEITGELESAWDSCCRKICSTTTLLHVALPNSWLDCLR
ncbi:MAG: acyl carrier protein [Aquincola sp.]|nr:acyl carrier protein [Aquincola sp.]